MAPHRVRPFDSPKWCIGAPWVKALWRRAPSRTCFAGPPETDRPASSRESPPAFPPTFPPSMTLRPIPSTTSPSTEWRRQPHDDQGVAERPDSLGDSVAREAQGLLRARAAHRLGPLGLHAGAHARGARSGRAPQEAAWIREFTKLITLVPESEYAAAETKVAALFADGLPMTASRYLACERLEKERRAGLVAAEELAVRTPN